MFSIVPFGSVFCCSCLWMFSIHLSIMSVRFRESCLCIWLAKIMASLRDIATGESRRGPDGLSGAVSFCAGCKVRSPLVGLPGPVGLLLPVSLEDGAINIAGPQKFFIPMIRQLEKQGAKSQAGLVTLM